MATQMKYIKQTLVSVFLTMLGIIPSAYASSNELAPMLGTWRCHTESSLIIPNKSDSPQTSLNLIKMLETYSTSTTEDGVSVGDGTTIYYIPVGDNLLPVEVTSHSKVLYQLDQGILKFKVLEWELRDGRIFSKERTNALAKFFSKDMSASTRSQLSAKLERLAEDFVESVTKSFQSMIGKEKRIPLSLRTIGVNEIQKTFGTGSTAIIHYCIRPSK